MERPIAVNEDFLADEAQKLPEGFDNIDPKKRAELLREFNYRATTARCLSITEISVGWDMYSRVPKESTAQKLEVDEVMIETIRADIRSWEALPSLTVLSQSES